MRRKHNVYLWTGSGWGKTTSALGVALRAIGHGKKVVVIQFMKGRHEIGEYMARKRISNYEIYQFGKERFVNLKKPTKKDKELARTGFEFAKKAVKKKPFLLILDEINLACAIGLLDVRDVIKFIDSVPKYITIYLTGRKAPKELINRADYATEIRPIKHPSLTGRAKKGIDY